MAVVNVTLQIKIDTETPLLVQPLPVVKIDQPYSAQLTPLDGSGPYKYALETPLPPGLVLSEDGRLSGTVPSTAIAQDTAWPTKINAFLVTVTT